MKENFDFLMPSVNFFGKGVIEKIGDRAKMLNMTKPLIVTDKFLRGMANGPVAQTLASLDQAGVSYAIYDGVEPNPKVRNIKAAKQVYLDNDCDSIITVGGGSAHDCGKGTGIILTNGDDITKLAGIETLGNPLPPLMAVNTTAGTASTGMDTFVQLIEPYVLTNRNEITDGQCIAGIKLCEEALREAVANGHNIEARTKMVEAEMLGGMAFNNADLGYVHAMAHQLGGQYDAPHGVCCAILLPVVEKYNLVAAPERFAELAKAMGENTEGLSTREAADLAIKAMRQMGDDVNIPRSIKAIGAKPEDFELMAENALKDGNAFSNPRKGTKEELVQLFQEAYDAE
ncbi:iron-containing alcohol dehydrogenase [Secundilactobacillus kimchicus]|uniref:iron-containing alcohol dehydrogenase n=1 Tax=Secundilactobacillus kimchicus TaxID=528209 RepID=UPI0024A91078|nr:iron-containing alcohol dehydrogenase [Secundilactobacillus kimchicus]